MGDRPLWVDARAFDIRDHVGASPVPAPNDSQLLAVTETLRRRPLDRSRPLWEMWFMPGLVGGRVGMYIRVHHVIADGVAGAALLTALLTTSPDVTSPAASSPEVEGRSGTRWAPAPLPATRDLFGQMVVPLPVGESDPKERLRLSPRKPPPAPRSGQLSRSPTAVMVNCPL